MLKNGGILCEEGKGRLPDALDDLPAAFTPACRHLYSPGTHAIAADYLNPATGAIGVFASFTRDIPLIDKTKTFFKANISSLAQCFHRGGRPIRQFVGRGKGRDMPRNGRVDILDKTGQLLQLLAGIVETGNKQGGDFNPDSQLMHETDSIKDWLEAGLAYFFVESIAEGLDVDINAIQHRRQVAADLWGHVAVTDKDVFQVMFMGENRAVKGELIKNGGFDIGITDTGAAGGKGRLNNLLGAPCVSCYCTSLEMGILGDLVVLAMLAMKVAAHRGNGVGGGAGQEMKKGFFFNGVRITGNQAAVDQSVELASLVFAYPANATFTRFDLTTMITQATDGFAISLC